MDTDGQYVKMFSSSKVAIATVLSHQPAWEAMKECIEEYLDEYNSVVLSVSSNQLESSYNVFNMSYISRVVGLSAAMRSSLWYVLVCLDYLVPIKQTNRLLCVYFTL